MFDSGRVKVIKWTFLDVGNEKQARWRHKRQGLLQQEERSRGRSARLSWKPRKCYFILIPSGQHQQHRHHHRHLHPQIPNWRKPRGCTRDDSIQCHHCCKLQTFTPGYGANTNATTNTMPGSKIHKSATILLLKLYDNNSKMERQKDAIFTLTKTWLNFFYPPKTCWWCWVLGCVCVNHKTKMSQQSVRVHWQCTKMFQRKLQFLWNYKSQKWQQDLL